MKLNEPKFRSGLNNPKNMDFNILFLGMSNVGKTHWSELLSERYGLDHIKIDELICNSEEIADLIEDYEGKDVVEKLGKCLGKPWDEGFEGKEKRLLEIEENILSGPYPSGTIIDLPGSAIYHPIQINELEKSGIVIYLEIGKSKEAQEESLRLYLSEPKPTFWKGLFKIKERETKEQALARCYPKLLSYRAKRYNNYADIKLPYDMHRKIHTPEKFIDGVCKML